MKVLSNERQKDESFKQYRKRLKQVKEYIKIKSKGHILWNSTLNGTYTRREHGKLVTS